MGKSAEKGGTTGERFGDGRRDVASLEESVLDGVASRVALETLDENDGGDTRWPQSRVAERQYQGQSLLRTFGEASHATGIEDQHLGQPVLRGRRATMRWAMATARARCRVDGAPTSAVRSTM